MTVEQSGGRYFHGLDVIRFLAALGVAFFHLTYSSFQPASRGFELSRRLDPPPFGDFFAWGEVGVPIFFVISGVVIANSAQSGNAFTFLRGRCERLYPAVWICAPISFIAWVALTSDTPVSLAPALIRSLALLPAGGAWIDAPYWTLAHEIVFYGLIWLILAFKGKEALPAAAAVVAVVSAITWLLIACERVLDVQLPIFHAAIVEGPGQLLLTHYGCFFALGMAIWQIAFRRRIALAFATGLVAAVTCLASFPLQSATSGTGLLQLIIWLVAVIAIAMSTRQIEPSPMRADPPRFGRALGLATYPLYLIHFAPGLAILVGLAAVEISGVAATLLAMSLLIAFSLAVASIAEPIIRRPFRRAFDAAQARISMFNRARPA